MCVSNALRIYVQLHKDSGTFEFHVVQQLDDECLMHEHEQLSSWLSGPLELADWLSTWARPLMAERSPST